MSGNSINSSLYQLAKKMGIPFTKNWQPIDNYTNINDIRIHFLKWGNPNNPSILLLHGFAQSAHSFDFVSLCLADQFHVLVPDLRGHGDSEWAMDEDYSREIMLKDLKSFIDVTGCKPVIIIGLSLGGTIGYKFAADNPSIVNALVIVDVAPRVEHSGVKRVRNFVEIKDYFDSIDEMVAAVRTFRPDRTKEQVLGSITRNAKQHSDGRWSWKYDPVLRHQTSRYRQTEKDVSEGWKTLESVTCPTLFVRGSESDIVTPQTAQELVRRMQNASQVTIKNAGHLVTTDNPKGFIEGVNPFLQNLL